MEYRKDIQILRGVAVLLVVLFHLDIAGFTSGFLGVDVFFVVSGYLMAMMYDPSRKLDFFIKRAKRLLPAYFVVVIATLLASTFVTTPNDYGQVSAQALFAAVFASNIGFWLDTSYFDKSTFKPLLHLWSLGVEIQFYLLVPLLYWLFGRVRLVCPAIIAVSALLCFIVLSISPTASFFLLPFRLWEFLIGFGVAKYLYERQKGNRKFPTWPGAVSLVTIVCIPFINIQGATPGFIHGHPGLFALLICLATATTLLFGMPAKLMANPVSSLLEKIGGYSYSIYLAHFPAIALFLYKPFSGTTIKTENLSQTIALVILVAIACVLLFKYVEQPFRSNKRTLSWALGSIAMVLACNEVGMMAQTVLTPAKEMLIYQAWFDRDEFRCGKLYALLHRGSVSCEITTPAKYPSHRILLVGNSHADSIKATFSSVAQAHNATVFFMVQNEPLMKGGKVDARLLVEEAAKKRVDAIVLHYSQGAIDVGDIARLASLLDGKNIQLSFMMPIPVWRGHVPIMLLKSLKNGEAISTQDISDYRDSNSALIRDIGGIRHDYFKVYPVADVFCKNMCVMVSDAGKPLYFDNGHLTLTGSEMLRDLIDKIIADLSTQAIWKEK
jgi:peptidoglycan/LPS O-acetylase OafA/YrhL